MLKYNPYESVHAALLRLCWGFTKLIAYGTVSMPCGLCGVVCASALVDIVPVARPSSPGALRL